MSPRASSWLHSPCASALAAQPGGPRGCSSSPSSVPLWLAARRQLGTAVLGMPEALRLVASGLYSKIRLAIYVSPGHHVTSVPCWRCRTGCFWPRGWRCTGYKSCAHDEKADSWPKPSALSIRRTWPGRGSELPLGRTMRRTRVSGLLPSSRHEGRAMDPRTHWQKVYTTRKPTEVSWYQPTAALSLSMIRRVAPDRSAATHRRRGRSLHARRRPPRRRVRAGSPSSTCRVRPSPTRPRGWARTPRA